MADKSPQSKNSSTVEIWEWPDPPTVFQVRFLGEVESMYAHWYKEGKRQKSDACAGMSACDPAIHKKPKRWRGFAAVEVYTAGPPRVYRPAVLGISAQLTIYLGKEPLRGTVWRCCKRKVSARKVYLECYGECVEHIDPRQLRKDVNVRQVVEKLYRTKAIEWGVSVPFEAPQVLEDSPIDDPSEVFDPPIVAAPANYVFFVNPRTGQDFTKEQWAKLSKEQRTRVMAGGDA